MKAIAFDDFGKAEVLRLAEAPMPQPRPGDLLVKVKAAGVNRADLLQRQGYYGRQSYGESDLLGLEVAGEVVAVGSDVADILPGERVMAIVGGGAYAEYARVDRGMAVRVPDGLDLIGAAAVMESFVTAWEAVVHLGGAAKGLPVLVHAAAGGIGSAGVEIAHALSARVFATANAERRIDVLGLGAEAVFDYRLEDFEQGVRDATGGSGVDVIVDFVGGDYPARNLRSLAPGGCLVQVGLLGGQGRYRHPSRSPAPQSPAPYRHRDEVAQRGGEARHGSALRPRSSANVRRWPAKAVGRQSVPTVRGSRCASLYGSGWRIREDRVGCSCVRMSFESTSLMLERSERPLANSQEFCHGGHLYAGYRTDDLTLKQAALASGKVDEALFDKVVQPIEMVGVGLGGA